MPFEDALLWLFGGALFAKYVPDLIDYGVQTVTHGAITSIIIKKNSSMRAFSVAKYINQQLSKRAIHLSLDTNDYTVPNGKYEFDYTYTTTVFKNDKRTIRVEIKDDTIELYQYALFDDLMHIYNMNYLKRFIDEVNMLFADPAKYIIQFIMKDDGKWSDPIINEHRSIINLTPEMKLVKEKIDIFLSNSKKTEYTVRGIPYRYGLLLAGDSGTGKSSITEYIAQEHHLDIYCINLISKRMTDALLQQSCVTINKQSMIVIDEFDKMYTQIVANSKTKITMAGILSAIDGVIRLPDGCIVIVIMNGNLDDIITNPIHRDALVRPGRLDECVNFITKYKL